MNETLHLRRSGVTMREIDGETMLLDLKTSRYRTINGSGTLLLGMLKDGASLEQLQTALVAEYEIEPAQAEADVASFVARLREMQLVGDGEG